MPESQKILLLPKFIVIYII